MSQLHLLLLQFDSTQCNVGIAYRLAQQAQQPERLLLRDIVARLGDGDELRGRVRLCRVATALAHECVDGAVSDDQLMRMLGEIEDGEGHSTAGPIIRAEFGEARFALPTDLRGKLRALRSAEGGGQAATLTPNDLDALERVGVALSAALLLDLTGEAVEVDSAPS